MNSEDFIPELESLAAEMGLKIRYEKGDFDGGYCILKEQQIIVVNKKLHPSRKASVLATALGEMGIEHLFVKPNVRMFIEDEMVRAR